MEPARNVHDGHSLSPLGDTIREIPTSNALMVSSDISIPARPHPFPFDGAHTALIAIDLQKDFCHSEGYCGQVLNADLTDLQAIVPRVQQLIAWARQRDIWIIYTRESHRPDLRDLTPSKKLRYINAGYPVGSLGKLGRFLIAGEAGTQLLEEFQPLENELVLDKPAQSIFVATDLEARLRSRGITHLLFAGVTTQCCVLGSYRHASDLGFYGLLLEDCCAALTPREHQAALEVITSEGGAIGWVSTSKALMEAVG